MCVFARTHYMSQRCISNTYKQLTHTYIHTTYGHKHISNFLLSSEKTPSKYRCVAAAFLGKEVKAIAIRGSWGSLVLGSNWFFDSNSVSQSITCDTLIAKEMGCSENNRIVYLSMTKMYYHWELGRLEMYMGFLEKFKWKQVYFLLHLESWFGVLS